MTTYESVIVFGPTGDVGRAAALEASKRGAKVWLAMRTPDKLINGITKEQEQQGQFSRIQADLTDAASVKQAVQQSGAKAAYFYSTHRPDGMRDAIKAMKEAGIEYLVFLSTFNIQSADDLRQVPPSELIPFVHAQTEIAIEDVGIPSTVLRPAQFASNPFKMSLDKSKTPYEADVLYGEVLRDHISPTDIGRVAGAVLVNRPSHTAKEVIYLCGPQLISEDETYEVIKKVSGHDIKIHHLEPEEFEQSLLRNGIPPPIAAYLIKIFTEIRHVNLYPDEVYKPAVANIKKYSGYEPTKFEDYVPEGLDLGNF